METETLTTTQLAKHSNGRRFGVLVVDDHEVVHWGLRLMLSEQPWVERCLSARNEQEAIELATKFQPQVALVDLFVGSETGVDICRSLRALDRPPNVLLISGAGRMSARAAKAAGAGGFISKDWPANDIAAALHKVAVGANIFAQPQSDAYENNLSEREREVLVLIASGATNREIAAQLFLSPHTIKEHTSTLYRKLGVRNRAEAVRKAERLGFIS